MARLNPDPKTNLNPAKRGVQEILAPWVNLRALGV